MAEGRLEWWRLLFLLSGGLLLAGGPRHPGGTMVEMLGDPEWIPAHTLMLAGFVAFLAGLLLFQSMHGAALTIPVRRSLRLAIAGTALQTVEMLLHTLAAFDHDHLVAGSPTPILSTHLMLAVVAYPLFAAAIIWFIVSTWRARALGSPWIGWLGVIGALGHGIAAPLTALTKVAWARSLFPALIGLAVWMILAAVWPRRSSTQLSHP